MAKATNDIMIPFGKAGEPVQETQQWGQVPEGTYRAAIAKVEERTTRDGQPAASVSFRLLNAPAQGKYVGDFFMLAPTGTGRKKSYFSIQRFNGLVVAAGFNPQKGEKPFSTIAKNLQDKELIVEVVNSTMPATDDYPERETSRPSGYYTLDSPEARRVGGSPAATDDDDDEGEYDEEEDEDEDEGDEDEADEDDEEDDDDDEEEDEEEEDEEDDDEEEEEDEPEPPRKTKKAAKAKAGKGKRRK